MSYDIDITHPSGDSRSMNWLRNPFGLERWAHGNLTYRTPFATLDLPKNLYDVCNDWAYDRVVDFDRPLFKQVVDTYAKALASLEQAYFFFSERSYQQFRREGRRGYDCPLPELWLGILDFAIHPDAAQDTIGIPMRYFAQQWFEEGAQERYTVAKYLRWFGELVEIAELVQDKAWTIAISN